jgi:hypothetical protein
MPRPQLTDETYDRLCSLVDDRTRVPAEHLTTEKKLVFLLDTLEELETATTEAVVQHPVVDLSRQQVFTHPETLRQRGILDREQDTEDGQRFVWGNDG